MSKSSFFDTQWSADSVEFCPHPDATDIFVCGTYQLQQDPRPEAGEVHLEDDDLPEEDSYPILDTAGKQQTRLGKCLVFETSNETELSVFGLLLDLSSSLNPCSMSQYPSPRIPTSCHTGYEMASLFT